MYKSNVVCPIFGLILPGWGHAAQGRLKRALLIQSGFYGALTLLVFSRLIVTIPGVYSFILVVLGIHFYSAADCFRTQTEKHSFSRKYQLLSLVFFPLICLAILTGVFLSKPYLLGVQLYQVRSISMEPTLHDGDIILVDTWQYRFSKPTIGDVVLFQDQNDREFQYVKRVSERPAESSPRQNNAETLYVLGDNIKNSIDSRHFGTIPPKLIMGRAKIVLFCKHQGLRAIQ